MRFGWHEAKSEDTPRRRGFDFAFASRIFPRVKVLELQDRGGEARVKVPGAVEGLVLVVAFTQREDVTWIISARMANRKEREERHRP